MNRGIYAVVAAAFVLRGLDDGADDLHPLVDAGALHNLGLRPVRGALLDRRDGELVVLVKVPEERAVLRVDPHRRHHGRHFLSGEIFPAENAAEHDDQQQDDENETFDHEADPSRRVPAIVTRFPPTSNRGTRVVSAWLCLGMAFRAEVPAGQ